ncbi:DUF2267 domain-containing protein [Streptomyces sp. NPDC054833]
MDEKQFIQAVSERTGLTRQEAADLTRATLETLAHRLSSGEALELIMELPEGLARSVRRGLGGRTESFGYQDAVRRVAERNMLTEEKTDRGMRAVLAELHEAISEREFVQLMSQLGTEFSQAVASAE